MVTEVGSQWLRRLGIIGYGGWESIVAEVGHQVTRGVYW